MAVMLRWEMVLDRGAGKGLAELDRWHYPYDAEVLAG